MMQRGPLRELLAHTVRGPALFARGLIQVYRHTLSGLIGLECRHLPTCSAYADEAIDRFGLWAGGWMTLARLGRQSIRGGIYPGGTDAGGGSTMPSIPHPPRGSDRHVGSAEREAVVAPLVTIV
jgi:putative membrane protein insertion efficiency factor